MKTANPKMRYCTACRSEVHGTSDTLELWDLLEQGYCVALINEDSLKAVWLGGPAQLAADAPQLEWE